MEIVIAWPPNIDKIRKYFNLTGYQPIFCYGHTIYNPYDGEIDPPLMAHEATHSVQQDNIGPEVWWDQYCIDPEFRKSQEADAYRQQYLVFCDIVKDRNKQARFLHAMARDFARPLYGNIVTFNEALKLIRDGQDEKKGTEETN